LLFMNQPPVKFCQTRSLTPSPSISATPHKT
jgi:hypothetical protein